MLSGEPRDRSLPTLVTLIIIGIMLMTFDVRLSGGGVVGVMRSGTQALLSPLQKGAALLVTPIADSIESLSDITSLREENAALRQALAEAEAQLLAVQDQQARLELYEQILGLETEGLELGRTVANVIGRPDAFDRSLIIGKGRSDGILPGQPVVDSNGFVVGTVFSVSGGSATVVPMTSDRQAVAVAVGAQAGILQSQPGTRVMRLELDAREPVLSGDRVSTGSGSISYPAGLPVGEIVEDAAPASDTLVATVEPYVNTDNLRVVIVLAWPPDPVSAASSDDEQAEGGDVPVTTTIPGDDTTTTPAEEGG